ncbi:mannosyltransferase [Arenibacter sp. GZD96]|uniref:hypothetical protein n=1 Tax=Aurantibrevibacter litoralis TaxID=3106030 RepID=UPI002B000E39|nr:hypothetical protein [Arenibacter sp. GZD-96]MEA1785576.1 mannosyltransferase [Arenibacter sp. GZD-96]
MIQFEKWNFKFLFVAGLLFRLIFMAATPNLSQDFYRFIWDGELIRNGINPYLFVPNTLIIEPEFPVANARILYEGMGSLSARHFSNYPPLNQLFFGLSALFSEDRIFGNILFMRSIMILADVGVLYFGRQLLGHLNLPKYHAFWYFLNPLVIIELTGNLHFEGVMLFFFVWSLCLIAKGYWQWAAVVYALSISVKLVPILFLPLFLPFFGFKKSTLFYLLVGGAMLLLLLPFFTVEFIDNYSATIGLWFSNFEFNAGVYNLIKQIALHFDIKGYELIKDFGKISPYIIIAVILFITFLKKNNSLSHLLNSMFWILCVYYFLATTIHPWYIIFVALLGVFTQFRFAIVWSGVVALSYWAYSKSDFKENLWLLLVEYIVIYGFMVYEIRYRNNKKALFCKN